MVYTMRSPIRIRLEPGQCSDRHFDGSRFAATNNHQLLTAVDLKVQTIDGIQGFVLLQGAFQRWEVTEKCKAIGSNPKDPKVSNQKVHCELKMWYERDCKFRTCTVQPIFRSCCSMGLAPSPFCGEQPPLPVSPGNMFERFLSWSNLFKSFDPSQAPCESWIKLGTATLHWKTSLSDVFHSIKRHAVKSCLHVRIGVQYFPIENCHKVGFKMDGNLYESLDVSRLLYPSYGGWDLPGCSKNSWCSHTNGKFTSQKYWG